MLSLIHWSLLPPLFVGVLCLVLLVLSLNTSSQYFESFESAPVLFANPRRSGPTLDVLIQRDDKHC